MKHKLFHIQKMVAIALLAMMAIGISGCSKDDDEDDPKTSSLSGSSWTVLSDVDDTTGDVNDEVIGLTISFQKDGNVKFTPNVGYNYAKWSQNGSTLRITLGEDGYPDDYMEGTFTVSGNKATYKYAWYDADGEQWGDDETGTMTLQKK